MHLEQSTVSGAVPSLCDHLLAFINHIHQLIIWTNKIKKESTSAIFAPVIRRDMDWTLAISETTHTIKINQTNHVIAKDVFHFARWHWINCVVEIENWNGVSMQLLLLPVFDFSLQLISGTRMIMVINRHMNSKHFGGCKKKCRRESDAKCSEKKTTDKIKLRAIRWGMAKAEKGTYVTFPKLKTKFDQYSINSGESVFWQRGTR